MHAQREPSAYALVEGVRRTRATLSIWQRRPVPVLARWLSGSAAASLVLLLAVWGIAGLAEPSRALLNRPPFVVGDLRDVASVLARNSLVLALHAMACVAGFIAGSSLPLRARSHRGAIRAVHEHGGRLAIVFVVGATTFSLSAQALVLGRETASVAAQAGSTPGELLALLLPHALLELTALFLPLAAWILASRRGEWDQLLAATLITVLLAIPLLVSAALLEVYVSPHLLHSARHFA
ncbi:MAG: hypothetical protein NVSMB51_00550 [Solirubrobacteraceae bacterium]